MSRAVIAYIPAIHQGYINFIQKFPDELFVLDTTFINETPRMERDIRALKPSMVVQMIKALNISSSVKLLSNEKDLAAVRKFDSVVMPDEDISRDVAKHHLTNIDIQFASTFLRWDRQISTTEFEVPPNRIVTTKQLDRELMALTIEEGQKSPDWWRQVGGVLAKAGKPQLIAHNSPVPSHDYTLGPFGDPRSNFDYGEYFELSKLVHAEAGIIAQAAKRGISLDGASLYVSTFPCPVCAKSVALAGIKKVYYHKGYSMLDAEDILRAFKVELILVKMKDPPPKAGGQVLAPN